MRQWTLGRLYKMALRPDLLLSQLELFFPQVVSISSFSERQQQKGGCQEGRGPVLFSVAALAVL